MTIKCFSGWYQPPFQSIALAAFATVLFLLNPKFAHGQCTVPPECLYNAAPQAYKTIISNPQNPTSFVALINNLTILPAATSESAPQYLIICGPVTISLPEPYTFAPGSEIIFVDNTSGFTVNTTLRLKGTHVHGCEQLWNRIRVSGTLEITENSRIEDAVTAVHLNQGASFTSTDSYFDGNYISVYAGADAPPGSLAFSGISISGTTFSGAKTLLQPHSITVGNAVFNHVRPNIGILVENASSFQVGLASGAHNVFQDYIGVESVSQLSTNPARGIRALNSNVNVLNSRFVNIGNYYGGEFGYAIAGKTGTATIPGSGTNNLTITGLGDESSSLTTFENCYRAVSGESVRVTMSECFVRNTFESVFLTRGNFVPQGVSLLNVNHCRFEANCRRGIYLDDIFPAQSVNISENTFLYNNQDAWCGNTWEAIFIENDDPANGSTCQISNNTIINDPNPNPTVFKAITISNVSAVRLNQNVIREQNTASSFPLRFSGIRIENGSGARLTNNDIKGNQTAYPFAESSGIYNLESNGWVVRCNKVDRVNRGIEFNGFNCDAANFTYNKMYEHQRGLFLEDNTIMGDQVKMQNFWFGSAGQTEGFFNFVGYDPNDQDHRDFVQNSHFLIDEDNPNSSRWANPRAVGSDDDLDNIWFAQSGNSVIIPDLCYITLPKKRTPAEERVIGGTFGPHRGFPSTVWEASFHTFGRLHENPELRPSGSDALAWYNANYNSSLGQLHLLYRDIANFGLPSEASTTAASALDEALAERHVKEMAWAVAEIASEKEQLAQELIALNSSVQAAQTTYDAAVANDLTAQNLQKQSLLNSLNALQLNTEHEDHLRKVLLVLLESNFGQVSYTATQSTTLTTIAELCRLEGGYGVVLARKALGMIDESYPADASCSSLERSASSNLEAPRAKVFPNPTEGALYVQWESPIENATIVLRDILGRPVHQWEISGTSHSIKNLNDVAPGLYILEITASGQKTESHKLVIER